MFSSCSLILKFPNRTLLSSNCCYNELIQSDEFELNRICNLLKNIYNLKTAKDWNLLTKNQILSAGVGNILNKYTLDNFKCISIYKNCNIKPFRFRNENDILKFIEILKESYNLKNPEDWNNITVKKINAIGGRNLLSKKSLFEIKCIGCPDVKIKYSNDCKNNPKPQNYWLNQINIENFMNEIKIKYNYNDPEDWCNLTQNQIKINGGGRLLSKYSLSELKSFIFPSIDHDSLLLLNKKKPKGYWNKKNNILCFLTELANRHNIHTTIDWKNITQNHIKEFGGSALLSKYSLPELKSMFIENSDPIISKNPAGFWNKRENIVDFMEKLKQKYKIESISDWKRISRSQIQTINGGNSLLAKYCIFELLQIAFPDENWDEKDISRKDKRSAQRYLFIKIQSLFPGEEIVEDYFHSKLSRESGCFVQFDIFIVNKNIAIEYHGKQHYEDHPSNFASLEMYQQRDKEKELLCEKYGIDLKIVPYWWNGEDYSLQLLLNEKKSLTNCC